MRIDENRLTTLEPSLKLVLFTYQLVSQRPLEGLVGLKPRAGSIPVLLTTEERTYVDEA